MNQFIAEQYSNSLYLGHPTSRWWADDRILVGGSLIDELDWKHIKSQFGIRAVLSVESEHSDIGKGIDEPYLYQPVPDDGLPKPVEWWITCISFAYGVLRDPARKVYVHCQMGGSRSPAMAYAILRVCMHMTKEGALARIRRVLADYGGPPGHQAYMRSAEDAITLLGDISKNFTS